MILTNKKGFALIASLMVALIFLALGLALMLSVKGTLRQADTGRNNLIAYNLAEAGIADALFRLNYSPPVVGGFFPFTLSDNPLATSDIPLPNTLQTFDGQLVIRDGGVIYRLHTYNAVTHTHTGDYYIVRAEEIPPGSHHWRLISEGFYKGSYKKIEIRLRGNQYSVTLRQDGTQGIAEAFNKHAVYANTVIGNASLPSVTGNITCFVLPGAGTYSGNPSLTQVNAAITVPAPNPPPTLPAPPGPALGDHVFLDGQVNGIALPVVFPLGEVTYAPPDTYTFHPAYAGAGAGRLIDVQASAAPGGAGNVIIDEAPISNYLRAAGSITLQDSFPANATYITFSGANTALESTLPNVIVTPGIRIDGDLIVNRAALSLDGVTVNGAVCSDNNITFRVNPSTINALGSAREAAIYVNTSGVSIININISPTVIVGATQTAAIFAYSDVPGGNVAVNINANFNPTYSLGRTDQAAIIAFSSPPGGGTTIINIAADIGNVIPPAGRLIYAFGAPGVIPPCTGINLNSGIVQGCFVTNDTVNLAGGSLIYDSTSFTTAPTLPDIDDDIYRGFLYGGRVYLPAIGGWK